MLSDIVVTIVCASPKFKLIFQTNKTMRNLISTADAAEIRHAAAGELEVDLVHAYESTHALVRQASS